MSTGTQSYEQLSDALSRAGCSADSAEFHGGICASLCAGGMAAACAWSDGWLSEAEYDSQAPINDIRLIEQRAWRELNSLEFEIVLILPDDDAAFSARIEALASWCHGFVSALGLAGLDFANYDETTRAQLDEIIGDFSEISRASADEPETDAAGFQLAELIEFVRAGTQIVFELLASRRAQLTSGTLH